ncbi:MULTISPECIES: anti-phage dCTP deaminase [Rhizobium/Agrobacterium group]|uniref:Deoxycytidylate deaminase n=1 Tax=Rhizobium rhizogenes TaxID=359 RepID=A0A546XKK1_RHIRH|nr:MULTISPECIES: anti-phage dCTP deaminase [Rhizobium/Agrobacterium group]TRB01274.1 deoxycytidylate deaminase [Rhizobium rhizogenes]
MAGSRTIIQHKTVDPAVVGEDIQSDELVTLDQRRTQELVFAMVAPIGSGASTVAELIKSKIAENFGYETNLIKVSDLINERAESLGENKVRANDRDRVERLQQLGNNLREKHSSDVLAVFSIDKINHSRKDTQNGEDRRFCTIIDSLKNPEEVALLRKVYGDSFWLIGVFAPEDKRISRLENNISNSSYISKIKDADYDEGLDFGQSVRKTMNYADIFFRNDGDNTDGVGKSVDRLLNLVFGISVQTPTREEYAMQAASGVSLNSACLSRQVGAVIVSRTGEIIGQGANDVPKFRGGTYNVDDGSGDNRCYKWKACQCWNDFHKDKLFDQISAKLGSDTTNDLKNGLRKTDVKNLIEFSRAVHAEMEAIMSVARQGKQGIVGSKLFTTTFPCHSCARHIVASGIETVVYIEPYPKSLALTLHSDAITTNANESEKVAFLQYEGVSPSSFSRVFGPKLERKESGKVKNVIPKQARPLASPPLDSLVSREQLVLAPVLEKERI